MLWTFVSALILLVGSEEGRSACAVTIQSQRTCFGTGVWKIKIHLEVAVRWCAYVDVDECVVFVKDFPPRHGIVRGISYMTGYHMVSTVDDADQNGCEVTYLTQSDPKGTLPTWACSFLAPTVKYCCSVLLRLCLQCFDAVGWLAGRTSGL